MNSIDQHILNKWRSKQNSETFEFIDASTGAGESLLSRLYRIITSFLNTSGGTIVVTLPPAPHSYHFYENLNLGSDLEINPRSNIEINMVEVHINDFHLEDKDVLIVEVPVGHERPYSHRGQILLRKGESVQSASRLEILNLIGEHEDPNTRWERQLIPAASESDLSKERIQDCLKRDDITRAIQQLRTSDDDSSTWSLLKYFHLGRKSALRNSALVLFGKNPTKFFPQLAVRAVAYETEEAEAPRIIDEKTFDRGMFSNIDECLFFCERHFSFSSSFPTERDMSFQRSPESSYPFAAIREAILNALVHRDFVSFDTNVIIKILPSRIEIWNPGTFPPGTDLAKLEDFRVSRPRNPDIAYVLQRMGYIERLGSGINRIIKLFEQNGLPRPIWEEVGGGVRITLDLIGDKSSQIRKIAHSISEELYDGEIISRRRLASMTHGSTELARSAIDYLLDRSILIPINDDLVSFSKENIWKI